MKAVLIIVQLLASIYPSQSSVIGSFLAYFKPKMTVETTAGTLEGTIDVYGLFSYVAFKGIPYAMPPVGDLRFRNPVPFKGWSGVRKATEYGKSCPGLGFYGLFKGDSEDCLFLDVFSPKLDGNAPVMVIFSASGFFLSEPNSLFYGPQLLVQEGVVIVTLNYRLSVLGFLNTEDEFAQGNYGLKDMVLALKWVQQNIKKFGGNPDNVTVFGCSSGAVSAHLIMMSKMTQKLFHKVILSSGTALTPFAFNRNPKKTAESLGHKLQLSFNSTESLVSQLRKIDYRQILDATKDGLGTFKLSDVNFIDFTPSIECEDAKEERIITETPINMILKRNFQSIPMMVGTSSNECIIFESSLIKNKLFKNNFKYDEVYAPKSFGLESNSLEEEEVIETFKKMYFAIENDSRSLEVYHGDFLFKFDADRTVKIMAKNSTDPIFYYEFGYDGDLNLVKKAMLVGSHKGASHCDELCYIFKYFASLVVWPFSPAIKVRNRHVRLLTNFAKFGFVL
jgi:bile salt-stimulated lipase